MERFILPQSAAVAAVTPARNWRPVNAAYFPFETPKTFARSIQISVSAKPEDSIDAVSSGGIWGSEENGEARALVPLKKEELAVAPSRTSFQMLSKDMAMGLVLRAASGTGWTTGSGLEGPANRIDIDNYSSSDLNEQRWPTLSKSPRRRMRVAFTCNVCGERTTRAINPHAYTDGTVFVQCAGCNIFHKLVDNLKLFHELRGSVFPSAQVTYSHQDIVEHQSYDFLGLDDYVGM